MIELVEVSPRDGLQNEAVILSTIERINLVVKAESAGVRRIEVASFVNPMRVPQMADAEAVVAGLPQNPNSTRVGLVLNERGAKRALGTAVDEIGVVCAATDAFAMANQGRTSEATLETAEQIIALVREGGRAAQVTIAVAFGCPFEGTVAQERVVEAARRLARAGPREIALADTIGIARPEDASQLVQRVIEAVRPLPIRVHFHDTRGMGIANALAAVAAGAVTVDGSIAGVGGCPFAPNAAGNVASESLAYCFGEQIDVDLRILIETGAWLNARLGRLGATPLMRLHHDARASRLLKHET